MIRIFRCAWWSRRAESRARALDAALAAEGLVELVVDLVAPGGPYDLRLAPSDGIRRLDLGSLLVPLLDGVEYRLRLDGGRVVVVVALAGRSAMELAVFAAPKSRGVWADIRAEICASAAVPAQGREPPPSAWSGGPAEVATRHGRFGPELSLVASGPPGTGPAEHSGTAAEKPGEPVRGGPGALPDHPVLGVVTGPAALSGRAGTVRLVGIDGPRWFLRAAVTGPAADRSGDSLMDDVLRATIVLRGERAMPVRAPLPLRLPTDTEDPAGPDDLVDPLAGADPDGPPPAGRRTGQPVARTAVARGPATPTDLESLRARPTGTGSTDPRRVSYGVVAPPGGLSRNLMTWG